MIHSRPHSDIFGEGRCGRMWLELNRIWRRKAWSSYCTSEQYSKTFRYSVRKSSTEKHVKITEEKKTWKVHWNHLKFIDMSEKDENRNAKSCKKRLYHAVLALRYSVGRKRKTKNRSGHSNGNVVLRRRTWRVFAHVTSVRVELKIKEKSAECVRVHKGAHFVNPVNRAKAPDARVFVTNYHLRPSDVGIEWRRRRNTISTSHWSSLSFFRRKNALFNYGKTRSSISA
jgi:hypothetical protein